MANGAICRNFGHKTFFMPASKNNQFHRAGKINEVRNERDSYV